MKRGKLGAVAASVVTALLVVGVGTGLAGGRPTDGASAPAVDTGSAIVQLKGDPLSTYEKTKPAPGKKIDFDSNTVKAYRAQLNQLRNDFKQWLRKNASGARVNGEFDIALNAVSVELNGTSLATIAAAPMVKSAQLQGLYYPAGHADPDLALVHAFDAWTAGGGTPAAKGAGVKVAIVDSGIDTRHPCFGNGPTNGGTNSKVIFAGVFHMRAKNLGFTPADENGHGTHVAGTVACNEHTDAVLDGVVIPYDPSGVAPAALLGNFNVFPDGVASARSEDIVDALEEAYEQGFHVANMSLGGGQGGIQDLLSIATDNLDRANMVVAVAAGNDGPGFSTVQSPGMAPGALTAGASTVGHFIAASVLSGTLNVPGVSGEFATVAAGLTRPLGVVTGPDPNTATGLAQACTALPAGSLTDKIALISRGTCLFSVKIRNAQDAGAEAVLVVNNVGGDAIAMARGGIPNEPTVPAYMVSLADGTALKANNGVSTTITAAKAYHLSPNNNLMAGFSSQGPTDVDFRVKPDVVAPGVNVLSSQPDWACAVEPCWAFFQGTSMSTPHLAGAAAVVRGQHPGWSAAQVRSAIVNTADQNVLLNSSGSALQQNVNIIGAGRANVFSAVNAWVALDPVSVSFGAVPSGSGQSDSRTVSLSSLGGAATSAQVTNENCLALGIVDFGATLSGSTVNVTMTTGKFKGAIQCQGILRLFNGSTEIAHAAVHVLMK